MKDKDNIENYKKKKQKVICEIFVKKTHTLSTKRIVQKKRNNRSKCNIILYRFYTVWVGNDLWTVFFDFHLVQVSFCPMMGRGGEKKEDKNGFTD